MMQLPTTFNASNTTNLIRPQDGNALPNFEAPANDLQCTPSDTDTNEKLPFQEGTINMIHLIAIRIVCYRYSRNNSKKLSISEFKILLNTQLIFLISTISLIITKLFFPLQYIREKFEAARHLLLKDTLGIVFLAHGSQIRQ